MSKPLLAVLVLCTFTSIIAAEDLKTTPKTERITINDARDKRQLSNFDDNHKRNIQRRITTNYSPYPDSSSLSYVNSYNGGFEKEFSAAGSSYANVQNYGPTYSIQPSQYVGGYQQQQYIEAPEPIIEIIIKDSNETLPTPESVKYQPPKKKKEQVQVFYVKYNKDEKKGLIIDDPIPALTPAHFNQEESEEEEEVERAPYGPATVSPPVHPTTLRTIIKPDSEIYHSNSGIQVTFNTESKHQTGHEFQEHYEESALQPIISEVHSPSIEHTSNVGPFPFPPNPQLTNGNDRARAFDIPYNGNSQNVAGSHSLPPQNFHRFGPPTHLNSPQFLRPTADQGLLLSYTQNQANRILQSQNYDNRLKNIPAPNSQSNHRFASDAHILNFGPPSNSAPIKFRTQSATNHQPKPIPIPLHHGEKNPQQLPSGHHHQHLNHQQHYTNFNQFRLKQQSYATHQSSQFQQSFPQSIRLSNQQNTVEQPSNHRLAPQSTIQPHTIALSHTVDSNRNINFASQENSQNKVHFQQKGAHLGQTAANGISNQPNQPLFAGNTQDFNRLVSGAELVESLPKFEQHITETVPLSEINKPFSPFRQLTSIQSSNVHIDSPLTQHQRPHHIQNPSFIPQEQQHIHGEKLFSQQSFENTRPQQQPQQSQQKQQQQTQQKEIYHHESTNANSLLTQIVFPVNYPIKNYELQDQKTFNAVSSPQSNRPAPVFHEKVIPGKGVSNLATDVFGDLGQTQQQNFYNEKAITSQAASRHRIAPSEHPGSSLSSFNGITTERNFVTNYVSSSSSPTRKVTVSPSSFAPTTISTTTVKPTSKSKVTANLPDEVPDDLRQQLLSSGILENADISVLDYDKVGDIPLESLPPEHLANFYGAGGAAQISSSNRVLNIVKPNGDSVTGLQYTDDEKMEEKKTKTLPKKHNVDLKVVRFDSSNQKSIADKYIKPDSTVLPSVQLNQDYYNRYLPLKVNGEQFPIPDVESLRNKKISSVVVLAPVDGLGSSDTDEDVIEDGRYERDIIDSKEVKFLAGDSLKNLLHKPTREAFKKWLDKEAKTNVDSQSVVLLVVKNETNGQEIYMYDIGTRIVSRLKGELSSAFVNVAESNANAQEEDINNESVTLIDSGIYEKMPAMDSDKEKITIIQAHNAHQNHRPIFRRDSNSATTVKSNNDNINKISIRSGYSVIKR